MRVAAENGHLFVRMIFHGRLQNFSGGLAGEERQPVGSRIGTSVPCGLSKRRDVGQYHHMMCHA
jgi:hypothetical protein